MKIRFVALTILASAAFAAPAHAQFLENVARDYCINNQWPYPYVCWDRESVRTPFAIMADNGWRRQNLLSEHHFKDDQQLNDAGKQLVHWVLTQAPAERRTLLVREGDSPQKTASRMAAVEQYAAKSIPGGARPVIQTTTIAPAGYPAGWPHAQDQTLNRQFPAPRMPAYLPDTVKTTVQEN